MSDIPEAYLQGQRVLVTGGSRGIGASIVRILAQQGARVAFTYSQGETQSQQVLNGLPGKGHITLKMDVTDPDHVEAGVEKVLEQFGDLDGVVNNAGITKDGLILRMKVEDFDSVVKTNLRGAFLVTKAVLKPMLKKRDGSIVNISSVVAKMGNSGQANYSASKGGLEAMTRTIALEVASRGIRVNAVAPGFIQTEMTDVLTEDQRTRILQNIPLQRMGECEEIAQAVSFLLSKNSKYITGQTLGVNGGLNLA